MSKSVDSTSDHMRELLKHVDYCPYCGNRSLHVIEFIYNVPNYGRMIIVAYKCSSCGFKHTSATGVDLKKPIKIIIYVENPEDLNTLIVRSDKATIQIPELGILIEPGPLAQGEITTIEGYLHRILEVLEACRDEEGYSRVKSLVEKAIRGELKFKFIILDPIGSSMILKANSNTRFEIKNLEENELKNIKYGGEVLKLLGERNGKAKES